MRKLRFVPWLCSALLLAAALPTAGVGAAPSPAATPPGPSRQAKLLVSYTRNEWWLARWSNNEIVCQLFVDHEGLPTGPEIFNACGGDVFDEWHATPTCPGAEQGGGQFSCPGFYLHWNSATPGEREVTVSLPPPTVLVTLEGCPSGPPGTACEQLPALRLTGQEPLPNETILSIQGKFNNVPFSCQGGTCDLPLAPTPDRGVAVEFWANSSYGDSSEHFTAQVRVVFSPGPIAEGDTWFVDVLSTQWNGAPQASCSQVWETFPPVGGPPAWLSTPKEASALASRQPYALLAGVLIAQGAVDAGDCPGNGLLEGGVASACGMEKAAPAVELWQNRFDASILQAAQETGIPAQLMKNIFARESQFWPGVLETAEEVGLGRLTDSGADTTLLWNPSFFGQFCPLVLQSKICDRGFANLQPAEQATLRGALVRKANAECPTCPMGVDLSRANVSVGVFAQTLLANCEQTNRIVRNATHTLPSLVTTYEDLWRFTLTNYNAGPGCLSAALQQAWSRRRPLDWKNVSALLDPACQGAIAYVQDVTRSPAP